MPAPVNPPAPPVAQPVIPQNANPQNAIPQNAIPQNYVPFQPTVAPQPQASVAAPASPISNRSAWLSLGLGAASLVIVIGYLRLHPNGLVVTSAAATSIFWGVRALIHRRQGRATVLWAPIAGMLLGATSVVIIVFVLLGSVTAALSAGSGIDPRPQAQSSGSGRFPNNPELDSLLDSTTVVAMALEAQRTVKGVYPASVTLVAGTLTLPDGTTLTTVTPTWGWSYVSSDQGKSFTFELTGTKGGNRAGYSSDGEKVYDCAYKDCNVDPDTQPAPVQPDTSNT